MTTYTIYLNANPIACVADTNSAYACFEATKTIAEMTGGNASLVWDDTGEIVAYIDFTEEGEEPENTNSCLHCSWCWVAEGEEYPRCQYPDDGTPAPCEYEDDYYEDDDCDYEVGYDPYMGCYTDDC